VLAVNERIQAHPRQQAWLADQPAHILAADHRHHALFMSEVFNAGSLPEWSLAPVVDSLVALRGIDKRAAIVLLAELGDISRFDSPKQLMAYLALVPSQHSSSGRRRQGAITLTGNSHARRMLIESAWSDRFPARQTKQTCACVPSPLHSGQRRKPSSF
jgi:transposase